MKPPPNYEPELAMWVVIGFLIWGGYLLVAGLPLESREKLLTAIIGIFTFSH